jgi:predicted SprT family Zn-dependent metalloprotease
LTTRDNEPTTETSPNASTHRQPNVPVDDHKESPPSEDKADTSKRNNEHEMEDRNNSQAIAIEKSNVEIESSSSSSSSSSTDNETEDNEEGSSTDNNENEGVDRTIASDEGFSETNNNSNDNHKEHTPDNEENESDTFQNNGTSMTSERNTDKPTEQITSVSKTATPQCTNDLPPCDSELEIVMSSESPPRKLTRLKQNSEFPNSTSFNSNGASHNVSYAKQDNATTVASCKDSEDDILSFDCFASNMQSFSPMKQKRGSNHRSAVKMYSSGDEHPSTTPSCPQESQPTTQQQGQSQISMQFPNTENRKYFIRHRKEIAQKLYDEFNARIFEGRLPALELVWSNAMTNASGKYCSEIGERGKRISYLKLSSKFLTTYERLRKTLSHEMCHAATHLIDNELSDIHGPIWYKWAQLTETLYPDLKVSRCHTYHVEEEFVFKYQYACDNPFCDAMYVFFSNCCLFGDSHFACL